VENAATQRHILVVNDTQELLDLFRDILQDEGYRVSVYSYAVEDLAEIKRLAPDLLILDLIIGGEKNGWRLLQKLKLDRETMTIPILICTAAVETVRELEGHLRAKGVTVILKPFDIDDLLQAVSHAWDNLARDAPPASGGGTPAA